MPRRSILSASERESLLALPDNRDDLIRRYTLSQSDLSIIRQRRGAANRLGFAVQLSYLRYPGVVLGVDQAPFPPLLHLIAGQLKIPVEHWVEYGDRAQTRREHLVELHTIFGFEPFTAAHRSLAVQELTDTAMQTDKGVVLPTSLISGYGCSCATFFAIATRHCAIGKRVFPRLTGSYFVRQHEQRGWLRARPRVTSMRESLRRRIGAGR
jgi:hypothetical protein